MNILCAVDDFPWPEKSGYKIRIAHVVRALGALGDVDLFVRVPFDHVGAIDVPADVPIARVHVVRGSTLRSTPAMLWRWITSGLPRMIARDDWRSARRELRSWARHSYDVAWFAHATSFVELGDLVAAPAVVDLDNLEDQRIRHLREMRTADRRRGRHDSIRSRPRELAARAFDRIDERRWTEIQRQIALDSAAVTLCSSLDRDRIAARNVTVLPNGYELPEPAGSRPPLRDPGDEPVIILVGLLTYEPNADAAWFFADEVLPRVRERIPGVLLRLVGRYDDFVAPLGARDGIELRGEVPDVAVELDQADLSIVPVRSGGGTRIKVLEAFAREIPVVATTVGVEGIDVVPGTHLLVADDAAGFADACITLLLDRERRAQVVAAAHELWVARYRWSDLRPVVTELARQVAEGE
jgi:glycosyltransferase involved in cell wall biosynthesis